MFNKTSPAIALSAIALLAPLCASAQWTPQATQLLNFCLANPNDCSISINHISGGWQKDYHGTRLNVLASTFKLVPLIAYGEAVASGRLNPNTVVSRDQWAEFWTGQDGGALSKAWNRLGQPQTVTLDQMAGAMIQESDNATPDYLLDKLGAGAMQDVIARYAPGYLDTPESIGAMFTAWMGMPGSPFTGATYLADDSGMGAFGYHQKLDGLFSYLHDPAHVQAQRTFVCATLPWQAPPPSCTFGSGITEAVQRALLTGYFPESNTRTYTQLMTGLLKRNLLPQHVQSVIEPHLEWWLSTPTGQGFRRYGAKGGSLGTAQGYAVLTWTSYVETTQGAEAVVTIHLRDSAYGSNILQALGPGMAHFADALVEDPAFAASVRSQLPEDAPLPDLIPRVTYVESDFPKGKPTQLKVLNIGTAATTRATTLAVYLAPTSQIPPNAAPSFTFLVPPLAPGREVDFKITRDFGQYIITVVDPQNLIVESDKQNNIQYEKSFALK